MDQHYRYYNYIGQYVYIYIIIIYICIPHPFNSNLHRNHRPMPKKTPNTSPKQPMFHQTCQHIETYKKTYINIQQQSAFLGPGVPQHLFWSHPSHVHGLNSWAQGISEEAVLLGHPPSRSELMRMDLMWVGNQGRNQGTRIPLTEVEYLHNLS